jgi:Rieske Fe-S protein
MKLTRRELLKSGAATAASAAVVGSTILVGCGNDVQPAPWADFDVQPSGIVGVEVSRYPDLDGPKHLGAIQMRLRYLGDKPDPSLQKDGVRPPAILLVQFAPGQFLATQSDCPHARCPLGFSKSDRLIECPCHASRFATQAMVSADGKTNYCSTDVVHRPARAGLWSFALQATTGASVIVSIDLNKPRQGALDTSPCSDLSRELPPIVGGQVVLPFVDFPELMDPGQQVIGVPMGADINPILVARVDATTVTCIDALCTHMACPVMLNAALGEFDCPCHGSSYALDGTLMTGPAMRSIKNHPAVLGADNITVTLPP